MMLQYNQIDWRINVCTTVVLQQDELKSIGILQGIDSVLEGGGYKLRNSTRGVKK